MSAPEDPRVPSSLRLAAALAWRFLVVVAAIGAVVVALGTLRVVVIPLVIAIFLATLLVPVVLFLVRVGVPRVLATLLTLAAALGVLGGGVAAVAPRVVDEVGELDVSVAGGFSTLTSWLSDGPFGLSEERVSRWRDQAADQLAGQTDRLVGGLFGGAYLAVEIVAGLVLALVALFFLLKDGERIWRWTTRLFPKRARDDVERIGELAWMTIGRYLRGLIVVAAVDAILIGLALWLLGVPLVLPLAVLTFLGGFFPIVGAFVAGFVAAMVALVANGVTTALLVVGAAVLVQQLEGNVLQPLVIGKAIAVHPLAILLAVTAGGILWGVAGAFLAAPLAAVVNQGATYLANRS